MTLGEIYLGIDREISPFGTAENYDNVGILIGSNEAPVKHALCCLDITTSAIEYAKKSGADTIISHHPIIFTPLKTLSPKTPEYMMARLGLNALCIHTNLDIAEGGVNDVLAKAVGLSGIETLPLPDSERRMVRIGRLEAEVSVNELCGKVAAALKPSGGIRYLDSRRKIKTVAVCGGAGGGFCAELISACDAYITSDVKHHELLLAHREGLALIDAGHFDTEVIVIPALAKRLSSLFPEVTFEVFDERSPVKLWV